MNHPDLFTGESKVIDKAKEAKASAYMIWKKRFNYRKSDSNVERCKNCIHHADGMYHGKTYHKCELLGISHSPATDIRISSVCNNWERVG